jgi:APA family basic amino acid/polyamine antiporter
VAVLSVICYVGIRQSSAFNTVIVAIKVTVVLLFIFFGVAYINPANWHPFIPPNEGPGKYGISGLMTASGVIFFAYIGFDAISTAAQETKNPQRDMPIGILGSLIICTILYVVTALVLTGMVSYKELNVPAPVALAIDKHSAGLGWLGYPVKIGALAGMTSVMLVMTLAQARIFLAMARDGLLWKPFAKVHPKFHTPSFATVVTGVSAALIGGLFPVGILGEMVSIGTLAAFVTVCIGVLVLRQTRPDLHRPFRTPWPWFTCIAGAVICFSMMYSLGIGTWLRLFVWTFVGVIVYVLYGYRHSRLRSANGGSPAVSATH